MLNHSNTAVSISIHEDIRNMMLDISHDLDITFSKLSNILIHKAFEVVDISYNQKKSYKHYYRIIASNTAKPQLVNDINHALNEKRLTSTINLPSEVINALKIISCVVGSSLKLFVTTIIYIGLNEFELIERARIRRLALSYKKFLLTYQSNKV